MSQRQKQHMGRSDDDAQELVGRDVRAGDVTADRATDDRVPMPNEEGTDAAADGGGDARRGGSGSTDTST